MTRTSLYGIFGSALSIFACAGASPGKGATYSQLPLSFESNHGQAPASAQFVSRGRGYSLSLSPSEASFALVDSSDRKQLRTATLRMRLLNANAGAVGEAADVQPGLSNYLIGNDPSKYRTGIANYGKVRYKGVYPGIDLVYYGNQRELEYDFIVRPGADPARVRLQFDGVRAIRVGSSGDLILTTELGEVTQKKPLIYQTIAGKRRIVGGRYLLKGNNQVAFEVARYDRREPLIIDPVVNYMSYLGGSGIDQIRGLAVDSLSNTYFTGETASGNFPTSGGLDIGPPNGLPPHAFITKINATGERVYSTFLGGNQTDIGLGIAVDGGANAYVTGLTESGASFPLVGSSAPAGTDGPDVFVSKLNPAGDQLIYSMRFGGGSYDAGSSIALDTDRHAYVTGETLSNNFPVTPGAEQPVRASPAESDAFMVKINAAGTARLYATYLGGNSFDAGNAIAVSGDGYTAIAGATDSPNFPVSAPGLPGTQFSQREGFVTLLNPAGFRIFSSFLGGNGRDSALGIAIGADKEIYVAGTTNSSNFPQKNPLTGLPASVGNGGDDDVFISKIDPFARSFYYSTLIGGSGNDSGFALAADASGRVYVAGQTASGDFPLRSAVRSTGVNTEGFLVKLSSRGTAILTSTLIGGSGADLLSASGFKPNGTAIVAGITNGGLTPVQASQPNPGGTSDGFFAQLTTCSFLLAGEPEKRTAEFDTFKRILLNGNPSSGQVNEFSLVPAPNTPSDCAWQATSNQPWLRINADDQSGTGNKVIQFVADPNPNSPARRAYVDVGGVRARVDQFGNGAACVPTDIARDTTVNGVLDASSCLSPIDPNSFAKRYRFQGFQGDKIAFSVTSQNISLPFLYLVGSNGAIVNAGKVRIPANGLFTLPFQDTFFIEVTSEVEQDTGSFSLTFTTGPTVPVTLVTNPPGLKVTIDGTEFQTPKTVQWDSGSNHFLDAATPQTLGVAGTRYLFTAWSAPLPPGPSVPNVSVTSPATFTANFATQHQLTLNVTGNGSVAANPPSASGFYATATSVSITASPSAGSTFTGFSGSLTGSTNPQSVVMSAPRNVNANFTACTYTVNPNAVTPGAVLTTGNITVTAAGGCPWTGAVSSTSPWLTITAGAAGSGNGSVTYRVTANAGAQRTGTLLIAGKTVTVTQAGPSTCPASSYTVAPTSLSVQPASATGTITITAPAQCSWAPAANVPWISATPPSGNGSGPVTYLIEPNEGSTARSGILTIGGISIPVTQAGIPCAYSISPGGKTFPFAGGTGSFKLLTSVGCPWTITTPPQSFVQATSGVSGTGPADIAFRVDPQSGTGADRTGSLTIAGKTFTVTQQGAPAYACTVDPSTPKPVLRAGGITELAGDVLLNCSGQIPPGGIQGDLQLTYDANITSRLTSAVSQDTDALLVVDDVASPSFGTTLFRGKVSGYNVLRFENVPLTPASGARKFRVKNVRLNASLLAAPATVRSTVAISANKLVPIVNAEATVATVQNAFNFVKGSTSPGGGVGRHILPITFTETSNRSFRPLVEDDQQPSNPSTVYFSESGYFTPAAPDAGFATSATRFHMKFTEVPSGDIIYVPVFPSSDASAAQLVSADQNGEGGTWLNGTITINGDPYRAVSITSGSGSATWELKAANPGSIDSLGFQPVLQTATPNAIQVRGLLAPLSTLGVASFTEPRPRYQDVAVPPKKVDLTITSRLTISAATSGILSRNSKSSVAAEGDSIGTLTSEATIRNNGNSPVTDAVYYNDPPFGSTARSCSIGASGSCGNNPDRVALPPIPPGGSVVVTNTYDVPEGAPATIQTTSSVSSTDVDEDTDDNVVVAVAVVKLAFTFQTNPTGLWVITDTDQPAIAPFTREWDQATTHRYRVLSPQPIGNSRYIFTSWGDGNTNPDRSQSFVQGQTITANFQTQHLLTLPGQANGTIMRSATPADNYYNANASVTFTAVPAANYKFNGWVEGLSGTANPQALVMNAPKTVRASFVLINGGPPPPLCGSLPVNAVTAAHNGRVGAVTATFAFNADPSCAWTASSDSAWLQVFPLSGTDTKADVLYTVFPNFSTVGRTGKITINGHSFTVTQAPGVASSDERFVRFIYFNVFGRVPTDADVAFQINEGLNKGATRAQLLDNFMQSGEFAAGGRKIAGLYVGLLVRNAEFGGWLFQRNALAQKIVTGTSLAKGFIESTEWVNRFGVLTNREFVIFCYTNILLRPNPSAAEVDAHTANLDNNILTRDKLANEFFDSAEFKGKAGPRLSAFLIYGLTVQRDATQTEFDSAVTRLTAGTPVLTILGEVIASPEFQALLN